MEFYVIIMIDGWESTKVKILRGDSMPNTINDILNDFTNKVRRLLGNRVKRIILYGSYARGDYNKNSDIDIMILTDLNYEEIENYRDKISDIAFDIELEKGVILSPVIKNVDTYNARLNVNPFYTNVNKEGVVI